MAVSAAAVQQTAALNLSDWNGGLWFFCYCISDPILIGYHDYVHAFWDCRL